MKEHDEVCTPGHTWACSDAWLMRLKTHSREAVDGTLPPAPGSIGAGCTARSPGRHAGSGAAQ